MHGTELLVVLLGSVALLLWGVRMVRTGVTRAFGAAIRRVLAASTRDRARAFVTGLAVAGFVQSSTATTLIVSSFAARGLIGGAAALALVLGADVGSTVAAQILSVDLGPLAFLAVGGGVFAFMGTGRERPRHVARIAIGLGLMLLALKLIGQASEPMRQSAALAAVLGALRGEPVLALLAGAAATWAAHSSLAIVLVIASLAAAGVVDPPLAAALILGANVGGALAPLISQTGAPPAARRVPLGNLVMRGLGAAAAVPLIAPSLALLGQLDADPARLAINFHSLFNLGVAAVFLALVGPVARLVERVLPDRPEAADAGTPRYLDPRLTDQPAEALACAARETLNLGDRVADMLRRAIDVLTRDDRALMREVEQADDAVDRLHEAIKLYLIEVSRAEMTLEESRRSAEILTFVTNLEHVGDIIDKNLMELAAKKIRNRTAFSAEGGEELRRLHARVLENLQLSFNVFMSRDTGAARKLLREKGAIRESELAAADSHYRRLREGRPESIESSAIHMDVVRDRKRINSHLTSVAYPILEAAGELRGSRLREDEAGPGAAAPAESGPRGAASA